MGTKTAINRIDLGYTRIAGWNLYDEITKEFQETTPKEVKELIVQGEVNGLKIDDGDIKLDTEGFNVKNMMVKSAVGKFRPLYPTTSMVNCMYAVVRVIETDNGRLYEIISNKCVRVKTTPEHLKIIMQIGYISGVRMGANGEIEVCKGVTIEDKRSKTEQFQSMTQTNVNESGQCLEGVNLKLEKDLVAEDIEKAVEKSIESVDCESNTPVEQDANRSGDIFDNIDILEIQADRNTIPDDTTIKLDNSKVGKDDRQSKEQLGENKITTTRKTRKK